jgi:Family of unknown function (DUF6178)
MRKDVPAKRDTSDASDLLARILDTPHLAHVVPRLPAQVLHRLIERCGLEDCGDLVALATPEQLTAVFDLDLWRSDQPGLEEQFDADRFGVWLEVLVESGAGIAARKVAEMDADLVVAALAQHMLVVDPASLPMSASTGEDEASVGMLDARFVREVGGYMVAPTRLDSWDAIADLLAALDSEHGEYFSRVMHGCRRLSNSAPEIDGLDELMTDHEQVMFDLALERERRREQHGFVTPAQARAFLQMSRQIDLNQDTAPAGNPIATAYFRAMDDPVETTASHARGQRLSTSVPLASHDSESALAAVVDVLREAGVLPEPPRALLEASTDRASHLALIRTHMQLVSDRHATVFLRRNHELAYLANTILAACDIQGRPFTPHEASEAAVAVCNLGLENWPLKKPWRGGSVLPDDFLVEHNLVDVFQVGWMVLHQEVCLHTAEHLVGVLTHLRCDDEHLQDGLRTLRAQMAAEWRRGTPWRAHAHLEVIAIMDSPTWAALLGLTSEYPVMHAAIEASRNARTLTVSATSFDFISENRQIASTHEFMRSLAARLAE